MIRDDLALDDVERLTLYRAVGAGDAIEVADRSRWKIRKTVGKCKKRVTSRSV